MATSLASRMTERLAAWHCDQWLSLRRLILLLAFLSTMLALLNAFYASYHLQKQTLITNTLETNRVYANKLSNTVSVFIQNTHQQLTFSAGLLVNHLANPAFLAQEASRLRKQISSFDSVLVVDHTGKILATSPQFTRFLYTTLQSSGAQEALQKRRPLVSQPYRADTGRLVIMISVPMINKAGQYLGYVGGTIYLEEQNTLNRILGEHFYRDGSYLYVVDHQGNIIYHQHRKRVGDNVAHNPLVAKLMQGQQGAEPVINTLGQSMLAGFAIVPETGWGIVSQRPMSEALAPLDDLMLSLMIHTLPLLLLSLLSLWWLSRAIARPLSKLAHIAKELDRHEHRHDFQRIGSWYFEARQLKQSLEEGFTAVHRTLRHLKRDAITDPLTGLVNRRGLDVILEDYLQHETDFCVLAVDIDHFKRVNDEFGHQVGDEVLSLLAQVMRSVVREQDIVCRNGGEEFVILLPECPIHTAYEVAERLREKMARMPNPCQRPVTLSLGVAHYPRDGSTITQVFEQADVALYQAKRNGRNQTVIASHLTEKQPA